MKTALLSKVLRKKKKFMNFIGSQLLILLLIIGICTNSFAQLLAPDVHPKFVQKLPVIKDLGLRVDLTTGTTAPITVNMVETTQKLGLLDANGNQFKTRVWAYQFPGLPATFPGATIVAMGDKQGINNQPVDITWQNLLPGHFLPIDASLHMASPHNQDGTPWTAAEVAAWYAAGNVPTVAHLHGGHTESASDGLPEAWFTQGVVDKGKYYVKPNYHYDNDQEAATLWYHDHALGITRLNVYAGLAGFYLLRDNNEMGLIGDGTLPSGDYEVEIVVQDRDFDATGQLFLPSVIGDPFFAGNLTSADIGNISPSVVAEFFGNYILVNGMAWPKYKVKQTKYRFRMLNGSDSRFYRFKIRDDALGTFIPMMQIGTDNGLLEMPVPIDELLLAPGERADIVVDFSNLKGLFTMINLGPDEPFKGLNPDGTNNDGTLEGVLPPANPLSTGLIMQFEANPGQKKKVPTFLVDASKTLRPTITPLTPTNPNPRKLVLFEGMDEHNRLQPMLGTMAQGSLTWSQEITENPMLDDTEIWEVYNTTADAHPIHLHLVSFQIINREGLTSFVVGAKPQPQHNGQNGVGGTLDSYVLSGNPRDPEPNEKGWKDTAVMLPGEVTRVVAKFDREGRYVWHCHILSHEDHEMMRPFHVGPIPATNARIASTDERITESFPNPFQSSTQIRFELKKDQNIDFTVFDMQGKMIYHNLDYYREGKNAIFWDGFDKDGKILQTGVYLYKLQGEGFEESNRLVIER